MIQYFYSLYDEYLDPCNHASHVPDGYTIEDIQYLWKNGENVSVEVVDDVRLAQYDLIEVKTSNHTERTIHGIKNILADQPFVTSTEIFSA